VTKPQLGLGFEPPRRMLPTLDRRERGTTFLGLEISRILNSPDSTGMSFWSINPYIGCEFGCSYCYARDTHRWAAERHEVPPERSPRDEFERRIMVKRGAPDVLRRTLDPAKIGSTWITIGTATDPYQPAERRFGITRSLLEAFLGWRGLRIAITTKSPLVTRDIDLLTELSTRHRVSVNVSIISLDPKLVRRLEPKTPLPHARIRGLETLTAAGIQAGLLIAPVIPGLTDGWKALDELVAAGRRAGASFAEASPLRLSPVARSGFLPVLERHYPELVARYRRRFDRRASAGRDYTAALADRIARLRERHGYTARRPSSRPGEPPPVVEQAKQLLFLVP
jgi:DNA repair photolyase